MIDLYYWPTPNGHKISIMLEECDLDYTIVRLDIGAGDQFSKEFLRICPNNRMPAIIDHDNDVSVFEGGAILVYLAEKAGMLLPEDPHGRNEVMQWLFWQAAGLGPMAGQYSHFFNYAEDKITYALDRYANEYDRLLAVMDVRLRDRDYLAGDYSIVDIASYPWVAPAPRFGIELDKFTNLSRWVDAIGERPAVVKGMDIGSDWKRDESRSETARALLFGQNSETVFNAFKAAEQ